MTKLLIGVLLSLGCHSSSDTNRIENNISPGDSTTTPGVTNVDTIARRTLPLFDNQQAFKILSFTSSLYKNTTDTDTLKCAGWALTKENISHIIKNSEQIDGTTWDLSFSILTCTKSVKVVQGAQQFGIEMNAGSFFSVSNGDTTVLYGDYKRSDRKYFIEGPSNE